MAGLYGSKLGNMSHVASLLKSDKPLEFFSSLDTEDSSVGAVLKGLYAANKAYTEFEYTTEQKEEKTELGAIMAGLVAQDIDTLVLTEVMEHASEPAKALVIMQSLPERKLAHAAQIASVQSKLDTLSHAAQIAAETAFSGHMKTTSTKGDGTKAERVPYPCTGIVVRCEYNRGKKSVIVVVHDANTYRLYTAKNGFGKTIAYDSANPPDKSVPAPTIKALSTVRKLADCFRKDLSFTTENMAKQTNGVGTAIEADKPGIKGGTMARIVSDDPVAWEKTNAATVKSAKDAAKAQQEEKTTK